MYLNAHSIGRPQFKTWCSRAVSAAAKYINKEFENVAPLVTINLRVDFNIEESFLSTITTDKSIKETNSATVTIPVLNWENVLQATPFAVSSLLDSLIASCEIYKFSSDQIKVRCKELNIQLHDKVSQIGSINCETEEGLDEWLDKFTSVDPFFRDIANDYSPIGSDTGADVLDLYKKWRREGNKPGKFQAELFQNWEISSENFDEINPDILTRKLPEHHFDILTGDDATIAIAFSQFFVDGKILNSSKSKALCAIERQKLTPVLKFRGWTSQVERIKTLNMMKDFLENNS